MGKHLSLRKKKKKLKLWEKIFLIASITFIVFCFIFYGYRLIHFYKEEHKIIESTSNDLFTKLLQDNGTVVTGSGLYNENENYYFKGNINSNYVYYSGRLWRVISIDKENIRLISEDSQTTLAWGPSSDFETSYINEWLNELETPNTGIFIKTLNNSNGILVKTDYCVDSITLDNITCEKKYNNYVGLLSTEEYLRADGKNSYLNNGTYFWLSNTSNDNKVWYVFDEGGINNNSSTNSSYSSYGVRPVITIKRNVIVNRGNGSKEEPYYLDGTNDSKVSSLYIGNYVKLSNYVWQITEKNSEYTKLVMKETLKVNDQDILMKYDYSDSKKVETLKKYLNGTFYNTLDKEKLVECNFNTGSYTGEDYKNVYSSSIKNYVGLQNIGELFIASDKNTWLYNNIDSKKLIAYTSVPENLLFADKVNNTNYIRPVICIKNTLTFSEGNGLENNPYILEDSNETNN